MWDWDGSFEPLAHSASVPAWVAVAAAAFFGLVFLLTLVRADRTVANGSLAALTFAGLAIAAIVGLRSGPEVAPERAAAPSLAGIPALACIDDLAGETALAACEKVLFSAPETVAAAVAYTIARVNRLTVLGDVSAANRAMTPDLQALRNAIERDRYGLVAYVLATRDRCQPAECALYTALTDHNQIDANMDGLIYEGLVAKYAPTWAANAGSILQAPSGRPSTVDFPTSSSIPPVNIMTAEPPLPSRSSPIAPQPEATAPAAVAPTAAAPAASGGPFVPARTASAPRKRSPAKRAATPARSPSDPVQITPPVAAEQ